MIIERYYLTDSKVAQLKIFNSPLTDANQLDRQGSAKLTFKD